MASKEPTEGGEAKENTSRDYYFDSYAHFGIHEEMLKDEMRTLTYRQSLTANAHLIKDKVVLDVGCGTGILSMFAAQSGAKHVYAVDCSDIIDHAIIIARDNGFADKITYIKGKVEEIKLPVDHVDVIVSEWMGYALLYESMLNSVLYARDKWLVKGGTLLPDRATIYLSAIEDSEYKNEKVNWWDNVYGFNMGCLKKLVVQEPLVDVVNPGQIVTDYYPVYSFNVDTVTVDELTYEVPFELACGRDDYVHALVMHFDTLFSKCHTRLILDTSPRSTYTHWKQTVFYLNEVLTVKSGEVIKGTIRCSPNAKNHRDMDFRITLDFKGELSEVHLDQLYKMK